MEGPMAQLTRDEILTAVAEGKSLAYADLSGANLSDANLSGANLSGAFLSGANLSYVGGVICAGTDRRGYRFVGVMHADGPRIAAGCRWFTLDEARAHWASNPDALARVELIAGWGARQSEVE